MIERRAGRSVSDIFVQSGEDAFRELEREVVADALATHAGVLALGGGAVMDANSRALLIEEPQCGSKVDTDTAVRRVGLNAPRPVLLGNVRGQLKALTAEREPLYTEVATIQIDTSDREPGEIAAQIIGELDLEAPQVRQRMTEPSVAVGCVALIPMTSSLDMESVIRLLPGFPGAVARVAIVHPPTLRAESEALRNQIAETGKVANHHRGSRR